MRFARAAVQVAMEEHVPLMAVLAGRDCGGEEGALFMKSACEKMGRPLDVVLHELDQARGDGHHST